MLAENNECFVSTSNTILSFQAHPEIGPEFGRKILQDDDPTYTEGQTQEEVEKLIKGLDGPQDCLDLLRRVVEWADEK